MAFVAGYEFIIQNDLGILFNFYLNEKKCIEYIASDKKGIWKDKNVVLEEPANNFCVEVHGTTLHLLSFHENGALYYSKFEDGLWQSHLIAEYPVTRQKVLYPTLKLIDHQIHIFYYLIDTEHKRKAYLLHMHFHNNKYHNTHVTTISSNSYFNSFKVFHTKDSIFILYSSLVHEFEQIFISKLNLHSGKWNNPICITESKDKKIYIDGLLDHDHKFHILWSKYDDEYLVVQYLNLSLDTLSGDLDAPKPISLSSKSSCSFPTLVYYQKALWVIWVEMNKIISSYTLDNGRTWSKYFIHEDTRKFDFKRYRYSSSKKQEENHILCDFVFGSLYPDIQFLGFGGETRDDIPTDQ